MTTTTATDRLRFREIAPVGDETMRYQQPPAINPHLHYWCIPGLFVRRGATTDEMIKAVEDKFRPRAIKVVMNQELNEAIKDGKPYLNTRDRTRLLTDLRGILSNHIYNGGKSGFPLETVGRMFNRDHSSVIHYNHRHQSLYGSDKQYAALADEVYGLIGYPNTPPTP